MKRIIVIGCGGAGKSTLSRKLASIIKLPLIHLDREYWKPNWETTAKPEWREKLQELLSRDTWIMDGNFKSTMDMRMQIADTIIFLDYPTWKCLWRVISRTWKNKGKSRPDMTEGCDERWDWEFLRFVATYRRKQRPIVLDKITMHQDGKEVYVFTTDRQAEAFLNLIQTKYP